MKKLKKNIEKKKKVMKGKQGEAKEINGKEEKK